MVKVPPRSAHFPCAPEFATLILAWLLNSLVRVSRRVVRAHFVRPPVWIGFEPEVGLPSAYAAHQAVPRMSTVRPAVFSSAPARVSHGLYQDNISLPSRTPSAHHCTGPDSDMPLTRDQSRCPPHMPHTGHYRFPFNNFTHFSLPFLGAFHLSLTVLVRYRSLANI